MDYPDTRDLAFEDELRDKDALLCLRDAIWDWMDAHGVGRIGFSYLGQSEGPDIGKLEITTLVRAGSPGEDGGKA